MADAVDDAGVAPGTGLLARAPTVDRRRVLVMALLAPASAGGLAACTGGPDRRSPGPDPLIALADAARADAALAAGAIAANPDLTARVDPLRAARLEHAAALDAEVVRAGGTPRGAAPAVPAAPSAAARPPTSSSTAPTGVAPPVTLARVREAVAASQRGAAQLVPDLPSERVGLVASVAACCATYAAVLV